MLESFPFVRETVFSKFPFARELGSPDIPRRETVFMAALRRDMHVVKFPDVGRRRADVLDIC